MKIYKKLFSYIPGMKYLGVGAIFFSALSGLGIVCGYYYLFRFLDTLIIKENLLEAKQFAILVTLFLTAGPLIYILSATLTHIAAFRLETMLKKRGIDGLGRASFRFFDLNPSGTVRKIIDDNSAQTHMAVAHLIPDNAQAIVIPILSIGLAFLVSLRVGIALVILTVVSFLILNAMMGEKEFMKIYQVSLDRLGAETVEYVRGIPVIKIFGANVKSFKALHGAIMEYSKYAYEYSKSCELPYVIYQLIFFGLIALIGVPLPFFLTGLGDPKKLALELIMTLFISSILFSSFMKIMWLSMYIFRANYAVDALEKLYDEMGKDNLEFGTETEMKHFDISFDNVTFGYNETKVLQNLSFELKEGRSYALVGNSGSGKSTIAKLISGFYKVDDGSIKIGGKPIEAYTEDCLIRHISFVFQNPKLFKKSLYDNVALAKKGATEEEVLQAMSLAGCDEILKKLPEKEKTLIGTKGVYLSGGEKQRVAIARAILKGAEIIIMDEASASIDPDNEHELQKAFKNLIKGKTVIMIAHRLSSIRAVDEILVLEDGKVVERGTDRELMEGESRYRRIQMMFNSANEWRVQR